MQRVKGWRQVLFWKSFGASGCSTADVARGDRRRMLLRAGGLTVARWSHPCRGTPRAAAGLSPVRFVLSLGGAAGGDQRGRHVGQRGSTSRTRTPRGHRCQLPGGQGSAAAARPRKPLSGG